MDHTLDPSVSSWVPTAHDHPDFPVQNLPLCVFSDDSRPGGDAGGGIRIGDCILDLTAVAKSQLLAGTARDAAAAASATSLNEFFALGSPSRAALRSAVHRLLTDASTDEVTSLRPMLHPVSQCTLHLPAQIGDFTDFYAGIHHARNVGALFRPETPLLPNYKWVPIGYHGRASTVQISGAPVHRPRGQLKDPARDQPMFGPAQRLDYETELAVWTGSGPADHIPPLSEAADQVAGFGLLNDWSARDIQAWEYQPLGPFLAKNFATSVSGYVVAPEALEPYRCAMVRPEGDPEPLPHLSDPFDAKRGGVAIQIEVLLSSEEMRRRGMPEMLLSRVSTANLYWSVAQLVAHHCSGGCDLRAGDLLGSGTISSPQPDGVGSMLELTKDGALTLPTGEARTFLLDGDEVVMRGRASRPGYAPVGFGECRARILPPRPLG